MDQLTPSAAPPSAAPPTAATTEAALRGFGVGSSAAPDTVVNVSRARAARAEAYATASALLRRSTANAPAALSGAGNVDRARYSNMCRMMRMKDEADQCGRQMNEHILSALQRHDQRGRQSNEHNQRVLQKYSSFADAVDGSKRTAHKPRGPRASMRSMRRKELYKLAAEEKQIAQTNTWPTFDPSGP